MEPKNYKMFLAINTHWDREYRWSFVETQIRLVEAVDLLIDTMEKDKRFKYFHTDSQVSFLDDYLEVRPENHDRVAKLVREGRLLTGPWYTLPAEFLVSGEALVRNLLLGHRMSNDLGGVMKAGYNIFSWGQVSQLPQIYRQFGMDAIMFYRGIDQSNLDKLEFKWCSPDGSEALGVTFSSYHRLNFWVYVYKPYINGSGLDRQSIIDHQGHLFNLCDTYGDDINHWVVNQPRLNDFEKARKGLDTLMETVVDRSSTDNLLFLQGFDQENPDPIVPDLVDQLNEKIDFGNIEIGTIGEYLDAVRDGLKNRDLMETLTVFEGEMLNVEQSGDPFAPLYNGVFSARMPLKQMNTDCENRLENWAEPVAVWASLSGRAYPFNSLMMAWKEILRNQQHDGIGGCHVDRVTTTMIERYRNARDIAEVITRDSLMHLVADIDYSDLDDKQIGLTVFNPSAQQRSEVVEAVVDIPHEWGLRFIPGTSCKMPITVQLENSEGKQIPVQLLGLEDDTVFGYLKYGSHIHMKVTRCRIVFEADVIPAMGYAGFKLTAVQRVDRPIEWISPEMNVLENEHLHAEINSDGTISLLDKKTTTRYERLHYFDDDGEMGGPLIHQVPNGNCIYSTLGQPAEIGMIENGPLITRYRIERTWMLPESLDAQMKIHVPHGSEWVDHGAVKRSNKKKAIKIVTQVTLRKDSLLLEFETTVENTVKDHRLRICFDSDIADATHCNVDAPYDIVSREIAIPDSSGWYEAAARTLPAHSFVDVSNGKRGLTVVQTGLPEYEVVDDPHRTIALTLLRCFGTAGNNSETFVPQDLAQCQGRHVFKYAVLAHEGDYRQGTSHVYAERFNAPLRVVQSCRHKGAQPQRKSFLSVDNPDFVVTALKRAEYSDDFILRGFNAVDKGIKLKITLDEAVRSVTRITLEEKDVSKLAVKDNAVTVPVQKGQIVSLRLSV